MLAMQNFMGLVPSTSLLCGKPTSVKSGENVECTGQAVIGTCTPFLTENEAIFMRSLLGRLVIGIIDICMNAINNIIPFLGFG